MVRKILLVLIVITAMSPLVASAQVNNVLIDGLFDDWQDESTTFDSNDGMTSVCDDSPGQGDMTGAGIASNFDTLQPATTIYLRFDFDETGTPGLNTMDGCWLLDANANGFVEQALCFTTTGDPGLLTDTRYFTCNDSTIDTCAAPTTPVPLPTSAVCNVGSVSGANILNSCPGNTEDRGAECEIALLDFPIGLVGNTVTLLEACTYNSSQPNSVGVDCAIDPNNPWTINVDTGGTDAPPLPVELQSFSVE